MVWDVVRNGLWILGLAVLLATWSWVRYAAYKDRVNAKEKLNELTYALILDLGLVLFIAGMAATEDRGWARLLWLALGIVVIVHAALRTVESRGADSTD